MRMREGLGVHTAVCSCFHAVMCLCGSAQKRRGTQYHNKPIRTQRTDGKYTLSVAVSRQPYQNSRQTEQQVIATVLYTYSALK